MKLWLIRHAKSDWNTGAVNDFDRPLNARGQRDGPRMADWLAGQDDPASWIWTSRALRASSTARFVATGFAAAQPRTLDVGELYDAGPEAVLEVIRSTPAEVHSVAVVAHNPGMTQVLNLLVGETVTDNLPTFGVARLDVAGPWEALAWQQATLEVFTSPRRLTT